MKFFIHAAKDKEEEQSVYSAIKEFLGKELDARFDDRKVQKLHYVHDGKEYYTEVGQPHTLNGEPVIAILHEPGRNLYHVCTTNRGVVRGISILVGEHLVRSMEDFDTE